MLCSGQNYFKRNFLLVALIFCISVSLCKGNCTTSWTEWTPCYDGSTLNQPNWKERLLELCPKQEGEADDAVINPGYTVNMVDVAECAPSDTPEALPPSLENTDCTAYEMEQCGNGRCIDKKLFCNFEDDCGDNSDEHPINAECNVTNADIYLCGLKEKFGETSIAAAYLERWLKGIPGINKFANGFDILTGNYRSAVLDMSPMGSCRRVLIEGKEGEYYRLPANVASFRQVSTINLPPAETYTNGASLMTTLRNDLRYDPDRAGLVNELAGRVGFSQQDEVMNMIKESSTIEKETVYVQQNAQVTTAEITLQDSAVLVPTVEFVRRVMELPFGSFSYDKYLSFVQDFGTHYVSLSNLGGVYRQILGYSRCWLEYGDYEKYPDEDWSEILPMCSRESFYYNLDSQNNHLPKKCQRFTNGETFLLHEEVDETIVSTVGGTLSAASNIKFKFNQESWDAWVASIAENPTLNTEKFKLVEITELLKSRYIPMETERREAVTANLQKAVEYYLQAYDAEGLCNFCNKTGDYMDEMVTGNSYLTGTGADYQCYCSYEEIPSLYTCGSSITVPTFLVLLVGLILTFFNDI